MEEVTVEELVGAGLDVEEARVLSWKLSQVLRAVGECPSRRWNAVSKQLLRPSHAFRVHRLLYDANYKDWSSAQQGPPPVWIPTLAEAKRTNIGKVLDMHGRDFEAKYSDPLTNFQDFHKLSVHNPELYWRIVLDELDVPFAKQPSRILDPEDTEIDGEPCPGGRWLPGAVLNAAEACLQTSRRRKPHNTAIVWRDEDDGDDVQLKSITLPELRTRVCMVANALECYGFLKGDAIALVMPMTVLAVVIYLGIVLAGCVVVSIADSFSANEISSRLRISKAKAVFTQDFVFRSGKYLPLYARVVEAAAPKAIVLPACASSPAVSMRETDISWDLFLSMHNLPNLEDYKPVLQPVEAFSNILFSSGTTGEPKAIPWTHATPIKASSDAWAHHDIRSGDVVAWPTNLGWMMGPWLVYASLVNGATIALFNGSPLGRGFTKFVQDAKVTMLGVIPSIVRHWKQADCVRGLNWSSIRCFSSTGEASTVDDNLWLMSTAWYKPVIEYCGGTEIGGGFATGSMLQPQALACFSTPAMGCKIVILDEAGHPLPDGVPGVGECALTPSMLGASRTLLNANHWNVYYRSMPTYDGKTLRRHGDEFERLQRGFYKAHGRVDDTMNLGGIKVSSVEIERICNAADERVLETVAIGVPPVGGGPEKLIIVAVSKQPADQQQLAGELQVKLNAAVRQKLNPLFKVDSVLLVDSLPRTASNKVMRRTLRSQYSARSAL